MKFRIVGPHIHQAVVGGRTFSCVRKALMTEAGLLVSWSASKDKAVLKNGCRTLNEAKNLCRAAVVEAVRSGEIVGGDDQDV